jgi:hypothetical protein
VAKVDLIHARTAKKDEFYTQYVDIEKEMNAYLEYDADVFRNKTVLLPCDDPEWSNFTKYFAQNFGKLGLRRLISTSYAPHARIIRVRSTPFEAENPLFDAVKSITNGRIFTLNRDVNGDSRVDVNDLEWRYLEGDGDFRSLEVTALRDEADIIITNPPFSLFREFLAWLVQANKKFVIIGNMNALAYKEVFPLIRDNKIWLGQSIHSGDREFQVPESYSLRSTNSRVDVDGNKFVRVNGVRWFTNIDHGRRHQPLPLMTKAHNKKFSKHPEVESVGYRKYDNYNAIEVPFTDAIPSDHRGPMGVPISFLDKYSPEQFEIVDINPHFFSIVAKGLPKPSQLKLKGQKDPYARIIIKHRTPAR